MAITTPTSIKSDSGELLASWRVQVDPSCCGIMLVDHFEETGKVLKTTFDESIQKLLASYNRVGIISCTFMIENKSQGHRDAPKIYEAFRRNGFEEVCQWRNPRTGSLLSTLMYVYPKARV